MPRIPWYTGQEIVPTAEKRALRDLAAASGLSGSIGAMYRMSQENAEKQEKKRAAILELQTRLGLQEAEAGLAPDIQSELDPIQEGSTLGPTEQVQNVSGAGLPGSGAGGTPADSTKAEVVELSGTGGPYAGDESPVWRAMRWLNPWAAKTQEGPSSLERAAGMRGELQRREDQVKLLQAIGGTAGRLEDPMAVLRRAAPDLLGSLPEGTGGGRAAISSGRESNLYRMARLVALERTNGQSDQITSADVEEAERRLTRAEESEKYYYLGDEVTTATVGPEGEPLSPLDEALVPSQRRQRRTRVFGRRGAGPEEVAPIMGPDDPGARAEGIEFLEPE